MDRRDTLPDGIDRETFDVRAAGGVVYRYDDEGCPEVVLVHRPRYDDWSLPKGKVDPGESWEDAAAREVLEEIGVRVSELGDELPPACYTDHKGRSKLVRYWLMEVEDEDLVEFEPNSEVDAVKWCTPAEAARCVSYKVDAELLITAAEILA